MNIISKIKELGVISAVTIMSLPAFSITVTVKDGTGGGSGGLVGLATRGTEAVNAFNTFALGSFYLAGVVVFGMGCYLIYKEQGESGRGHGKKGVVGMLVGGALLAMPSMIGLTTDTLTSSDQTATACIGSACNY